MDLLSQLERRREPEVRGDRLFQRRSRPASVRTTGGGRECREADVVAAAPVPGDRPQGRETSDTAGRRHADAVDAGATRDGDAPAALGAGPEDGERVVLDDDASRPATVLDRFFQLGLLGRKVDTRHEEGGGGRRVAVQACAFERVEPERVEHVERAVEPEMMRRARSAAHQREHPSERIDEREVRLRVPSVDCDRNRRRHHTTSCASSLSSSCSANASWPISGWVRSALCATTASRLTAASAASRSYAATCWISPRISGASRACASGSNPDAPTLAGISTTSSAASPPRVPLFRTSTSWTRPSPFRSDATSPTAASL